MQIIKPGKLSLISKTYGFKGNQFAVGALSFFQLGEKNKLLSETSQWQRITPLLNASMILDLGYAKPQGEWLVAGDACAPDKTPVRAMKVLAKFGKHKKKLSVIGDRQWNGSFFSPASRAKLFDTMPLTYQRTYGGESFKANPLGTGIIKKKYQDEDSGLYRLANVYHPRQSTIADSFKRTPVGFAPLDICWPERAKYQGTYDQQWLDNIHPGFPDDTDPQLFNAAPSDQQIKGFIKPGEKYVIKGMNAQHPELVGQLPDICVRVFISQLDGESEVFKEIKTQIDTVWFFPSLALGLCIHRGVAQVNDSDGLDVKRLVLACEGSKDKPRSLDYYQQVVKLRTDTKTVLGHLFNDSQLMPQKTKAAQAKEQLLFDQAKVKKQQKIDAITQKKIASIKAMYPDIAIEDLMPPSPESPFGLEEPGPIPQQLLDSGDVDLSPYVEYVNIMAEKGKAQMAQQLAAAETQKQQYLEQVPKGQTQSLADMHARVHYCVFTVATDLAEKAPKPPLPSWLSDVSLNDEQADKIQTATQLLMSQTKHARQNSPTSTTPLLPLPSQGALLLRGWVLQLLNAKRSLAGRDLSEADLSGLDFSGLDMRDVMMEKADLSHCDFSDCRLDGSVFTQANLTQAVFNQSIMIKANLSAIKADNASFVGADLSHCIMADAVFDDCDFSTAKLHDVMALKVDLSGCKLQQVSCDKSHFVEANLARSDWQQAKVSASILLQPDLSQSNWQQSELSRCIVVQAKANDANFCGTKAQKVQFSNEGEFVGVNLSSALWQSCGFRSLDMRQCDARGSVFQRCDLGEANLSDSLFNGALFDHSVMSLATFDGSDCREAMFNQLSLRKCKFNHVDLRRCELNHVDTTQVKFNHCQTQGFSQQPTASLK
jgi:uncharacterized protein YjbI with pentapeptide repeats